MNELGDDRAEWLEKELSKLFIESQSYQQKALLLSLRDLLKEENHRLIQAQGELEGYLWSKEEWDM